MGILETYLYSKYSWLNLYNARDFHLQLPMVSNISSRNICNEKLMKYSRLVLQTQIYILLLQQNHHDIKINFIDKKKSIL